MSSNFGFGFVPQDPDDGKGDDSQGNNPMGFDMSQLGSAIESIGRMMQAGESSGPVNWDMARQVARQSDAQKEDNGVTSGEHSAVEDAVRLANLWLDEAESYSATTTAAVAWNRGEWVEGTLPVWQQTIEPVAEQFQGAFGQILGGEGLGDLGGSLPPELASQLPPDFDASKMAEMLGPVTGMMKQMGAAMFGSQVGQGVGTLSGEVLCSSDVGIPLTTDGKPTLVPRNINAFADGVDVPRHEVLLYIALRECAHQRLYSHVSWLRSRLDAAVNEYARGVRVDTDSIQEAVGDIDPTNTEALQAALAGGVFEPKDSPEQKAALARLETLLALMEGWVDHVVTQAAGDKLPTLTKLNEAMSRRRAAGGPAEKTFATLVGLELRPRRLREAATFWQRATDEKGVSGRDSLWEHPDLLPTAEDLDNLAAYWRSQNAESMGDGSLEAELAGIAAEAAAATQAAIEAAAAPSADTTAADDTQKPSSQDATSDDDDAPDEGETK